MTTRAARWLCALAPAALLGWAGVAVAGQHTWDINELYSNADGTIQFVELLEKNGTNGETGVPIQTLSSTSAGGFTIGGGPIAGTANKHFLIGNQGYADLAAANPDLPAPDAIIPGTHDPFLSTAGPETVTYGIYDTLGYGAGALPTDGILALQDGGGTAVNSPTNFAGETGSIPAPVSALPAGWLAFAAALLLAATAAAVLRSRAIRA